MIRTVRKQQGPLLGIVVDTYDHNLMQFYQCDTIDKIDYRGPTDVSFVSSKIKKQNPRRAHELLSLYNTVSLAKRYVSFKGRIPPKKDGGPLQMHRSDIGPQLSNDPTY